MVAQRHIDPYRILGVSRHTPKSEIQAAFVRLAKQSHPDVRTPKASAEAFVKIRQAWEQIRDSVKSDRDNVKQHAEPDDFEEWFAEASGLKGQEAWRQLEVLFQMASKGKLRGWEVEIAAYRSYMEKNGGRMPIKKRAEKTLRRRRSY